MAIAILKCIVKKGFLKIRKVNNRNIQYMVYPQGIDETRRSYRYFRRTIKNVVYYKEAITGMLKDIRLKGYKSLALFRNSDLDFIVEHYCIKYGIELIRNDKKGKEACVFNIYLKRCILYKNMARI